MAELPFMVEVGIAGGFGLLTVLSLLYWFLKSAYGSETDRPDPPSAHGDRDRTPPGAS